MKSLNQNKKAQVWVETVIYTLIAFVLIGAVLAFVRPKIEEFQDKAIIEQTMSALEDINTIILSVVQGGAGNKRMVEMGLQKGILKIDAVNDKLIFEIQSRYQYSEPGSQVTVGNAMVQTKEDGNYNTVTITMDYSSRYNITYQKEDALKLLNQASTPYKIAISNNGKENGQTKVDFEVI
jgi:type II secretory pathway pseudopilin PulG